MLTPIAERIWQAKATMREVYEANIARLPEHDPHRQLLERELETLT